MSYPKMAQLASKLAELTARGLVTWEPTSEVGQYQTAFSNYSVLISTDRTGESVDVVIQVMNSEGDIIEYVRDPELSSHLGGASNTYKMMLDMFNTARRQALGVESALDSILGDLEKRDDIPF